ncbi:hypothetical protein AGLY_014588 [Aphis glycines]|uniref:Uncharacterized protein n=1 Tax=Aphis glycines TaxID=307491 RepID=A0A6G0T2A7_APHGL|nr:hypothetical protein AGLY_014588 [Aphis glycines]
MGRPWLRRKDMVRKYVEALGGGFDYRIQVSEPSNLNTLSGQYSDSPVQYSGKSHSCGADLHSIPANFKRQVYFLNSSPFHVQMQELNIPYYKNSNGRRHNTSFIRTITLRCIMFHAQVVTYFMCYGCRYQSLYNTVVTVYTATKFIMSPFDTNEISLYSVHTTTPTSVINMFNGVLGNPENKRLCLKFKILFYDHLPQLLDLHVCTKYGTYHLIRVQHFQCNGTKFRQKTFLYKKNSHRLFNQSSIL